MRRPAVAGRSARAGAIVALAAALGTLGAWLAVTLDRPAAGSGSAPAAEGVAAASEPAAGESFSELSAYPPETAPAPIPTDVALASARDNAPVPAAVADATLRLSETVPSRPAPVTVVVIPAGRDPALGCPCDTPAPSSPAPATVAGTHEVRDDPLVPVVPAWAALPAAPLRRGIVVHTVREGDTLFDLAERYAVSTDTIIWANEVANPNHLVAGQKLRLLPVSGVIHRLGPDETLAQVAQRYGADIAALIAVNDFANPDQVPAGTEVIVPGGRPTKDSAPPPAQERRETLTYQMVEGDTVRSVAERFGISVETILRANDLADPDRVPQGTKLTILPLSGLLHTLRDGDTLKDLAAHYRVSVQEIVAANALPSPDAVPVGTKLLIPERAGWNAAPPAAPAAAAAPARTHRVVSGETLSAIAERYGLRVDELRAANSMAASDLILVGQELRLPGNASAPAAQPQAAPKVHLIEPGDTLSAIAARYGADQDTLLRLNGLSDPNLLGIGQTLRLPGIGQDAPAVPAPRPAAAPNTERYVVQPGDSVVALAEQRGTTPATIIRLNDIREPYLLVAGQELTVPVAPAAAPRPEPAPASQRYTVQPGDTLGAVARRYGVAPLAIAQANDLEPPYLLFVGRDLTIPGGAIPAPAAAAPVATPTATPKPAAARPPAPVQAASPAAPVPAQPAADQASGEVLAIARRQLGARYVWGGSSPQTGFDCSGFVTWVFRQANRYMPRDIWGQLQSGPRVARDKLQPGDLVFFQNTYTSGLSHNGIYVGNGQFINAASERTGVIYSRLDEPYWAARWYAGVRPAK